MQNLTGWDSAKSLVKISLFKKPHITKINQLTNQPKKQNTKQNKNLKKQKKNRKRRERKKKTTPPMMVFWTKMKTALPKFWWMTFTVGNELIVQHFPCFLSRLPTQHKTLMKTSCVRNVSYLWIVLKNITVQIVPEFIKNIKFILVVILLASCEQY